MSIFSGFNKVLETEPKEEYVYDQKYGEVKKEKPVLGYKGSTTSKSYNGPAGNLESIGYQAHRTFKDEEVGKPLQTKRGILDKTLGLLGYTGIVEGLYNVVDDDDESTFVSGLREGFKYMNPFTDDVTGRHFMSDVFEKIGWEDNPDKKSDNVARAVVGLAGDILLDPLSFLNPYGAASKVVKGSGLTLEAAKRAKQITGASDLSKAVDILQTGKHGSNSMTGLTYNDALKAVRSTKFAGEEIAPEVLKYEAETLMRSVNNSVLHLPKGGKDLTLGFDNFPLTNKIGKKGGKTLNDVKVTLLKEKALRNFGDDIGISPYYNSMMKSLRSNKIARMFGDTSKLRHGLDNDFSGTVDIIRAQNMSSRGLERGVSKILQRSSETEDIQLKFDKLDAETKANLSWDYSNGVLKDSSHFHEKRLAAMKLAQEERIAQVKGIFKENTSKNQAVKDTINSTKKKLDSLEEIVEKQRALAKEIEEKGPVLVGTEALEIKRMENEGLILKIGDELAELESLNKAYLETHHTTIRSSRRTRLYDDQSVIGEKNILNRNTKIDWEGLNKINSNERTHTLSKDMLDRPMENITQSLPTSSRETLEISDILNNETDMKALDMASQISGETADGKGVIKYMHQEEKLKLVRWMNENLFNGSKIIIEDIDDKLLRSMHKDLKAYNAGKTATIRNNAQNRLNKKLKPFIDAEKYDSVYWRSIENNVTNKFFTPAHLNQYNVDGYIAPKLVGTEFNSYINMGRTGIDKVAVIPFNQIPEILYDLKKAAFNFNSNSVTGSPIFNIPRVGKFPISKIETRLYSVAQNLGFRKTINDDFISYLQSINPKFFKDYAESYANAVRTTPFEGINLAGEPTLRKFVGADISGRVPASNQYTDLNDLKNTTDELSIHVKSKNYRKHLDEDLQGYKIEDYLDDEEALKLIDGYNAKEAAHSYYQDLDKAKRWQPDPLVSVKPSLVKWTRKEEIAKRIEKTEKFKPGRSLKDGSESFPSTIPVAKVRTEAEWLDPETILEPWSSRGEKVYYTAGGDADTPKELKELMSRMASLLEKKGAVLRSGGEKGADEFFASGVKGDAKEVFLPWKGFNKKKKGTLIDSLPNRYKSSPSITAKKYYPKQYDEITGEVSGYDGLSKFAKKVVDRNTPQVLGKNMSSPSKFILTYTPGGKGGGSAAQSLRIANDKGIPIFDMGVYESKRGFDVKKISEDFIKFVKKAGDENSVKNFYDNNPYLIEESFKSGNAFKLDDEIITAMNKTGYSAKDALIDETRLRVSSDELRIEQMYGKKYDAITKEQRTQLHKIYELEDDVIPTIANGEGWRAKLNYAVDNYLSEEQIAKMNAKLAKHGMDNPNIKNLKENQAEMMFKELGSDSQFDILSKFNEEGRGKLYSLVEGHFNSLQDGNKAVRGLSQDTAETFLRGTIKQQIGIKDADKLEDVVEHFIKEQSEKLVRANSHNLFREVREDIPLSYLNKRLPLGRELSRSEVEDAVRKAFDGKYTPDELTLKQSFIDEFVKEEADVIIRRQEMIKVKKNEKLLKEYEKKSKLLAKEVTPQTTAVPPGNIISKQNRINELREEILQMEKKVALDMFEKRLKAAQPSEDVVKRIDELTEELDSLYSLTPETEDWGEIMKLATSEDDLVLKHMDLSYEEFKKLETYADNDDLQAFYDTYSTRMDRLARAEVSAGRLEKGQADTLQGLYIPHMFTEEALRVMQKAYKLEGSGKWNPKILGVQKAFDKSRRFKSIEEANEFMRGSKIFKGSGVQKIFETDMAELYLQRSMASDKLLFGDGVTDFIKKEVSTVYSGTRELDAVAMPYQAFRSTILKFIRNDVKVSKAAGVEHSATFGKIMNYLELDPRMIGANTPFIELTDKQIKSFGNLARKFNGGAKQSVPLELYNMHDTVLESVNTLSRKQEQLLHSGVLTLYDKFLDNWKLVNTVIHPGFHIQNSVSNAFQSFLAVGTDAFNVKRIKQCREILRTADPKQTIKLGGKSYTYKEMKLIAMESGILDNTFFNKELTAQLYDFPLYTAGTKVGTNIEGTQRLNLFMSYLDQGKSVQEAVEQVNVFMFDYGALTDVERKVFKRIIPFYSYMRKNIPLEFTELVNQPQTYKVIDKIVNNIEKQTEGEWVSENERHEMRQEHMIFPWKIDGETYGIADQLPHNQFDRVFDIRKLIGQSTPLLKTPIEVSTGEFIYTGVEIKDTKDYLMNQMFYTKLINVASQKEGADRTAYVVGQLLGFPIGKVKRNPEDQVWNRDPRYHRMDDIVEKEE